MSTSFVPTPDNSRAFRDALGCFATGVTVISAAPETGAIGMTANSFSSLSLDPPLILWSPAKDSDRFEPFMAANHFAVHVLRDDQQGLADAFACDGRAFGDGWLNNAHGVPVLEDCLCTLECATIARHDAGDHVIVVGQVENAAMRTGQPLVFARGQYGAFVPG